MSVKPKALLSIRRLLTESELFGFYESLDEAHLNTISSLDEEDHLELVNQYEESLKTLNTMITTFREGRQYSQACIFSSLTKAISHKLANHYEMLSNFEQAQDQVTDLDLDVAK
ncbi:hypothetical protein RT717_01115 [Imperialibacter roseus]|uniref:Uncharacterized protein n=1 Tax=Imperialibacter roseus TaxID=1324217 RepID=A0ABZ0IS67_9BACT|nr:hypothetical protein [Imperialibacter roseus]WOK07220.1 hypothetical protein RT717_01115 [Imperialibacter roseus]